MEDNEEKDENNCEDELTVRFDDDGGNDDDNIDDDDDDNNQRTAAHSGGVCGAVLILDIAQLSQISQRRLSHTAQIIMMESDRLTIITHTTSTLVPISFFLNIQYLKSALPAGVLVNIIFQVFHTLGIII